MLFSADLTEILEALAASVHRIKAISLVRGGIAISGAHVSQSTFRRDLVEILQHLICRSQIGIKLEHAKR
jgi:hypothetical protein